MINPVTEKAGKEKFDNVIVPPLMHWLVNVAAGEVAVLEPVSA